MNTVEMTKEQIAEFKKKYFHFESRVQDCANFLGLDSEDVKKRCSSDIIKVIADRYNSYHPENANEDDRKFKFYVESDVYLYDLVLAQNWKDLLMSREAAFKYLQKGDTALDYGCGIGDASLYFIGRGWEGNPILCDIENAKHYEFAKYRFKTRNLNCKAINASNDGTIALESDSVDFILAIAVLGHCSHPIATTKEMYRVLKPGGKLVGTWVFNKYMDLKRQNETHPFRTEVDPDTNTRLKGGHFKSQLIKMGFKVIDYGWPKILYKPLPF